MSPEAAHAQPKQQSVHALPRTYTCDSMHAMQRMHTCDSMHVLQRTCIHAMQCTND